MSYPSRVARPVIYFLLAAILCIPAAASGQSAARVNGLLGEYALRDGGPAAIRITRDGQKMQVSARQGAEWSPPDDVLPCEDDVYAGIFGDDWSALDVRGLCSARGSFGLFRLKKGATVDGHTFETGYFMVFVGGTDVYPL